MILKAKVLVKPDELEKIRKKISDDLKSDGVAMIPSGYEVLVFDDRCSDPPVLEDRVRKISPWPSH